MRRRLSQSVGFTLVELLVAIGIIAMLIAILLPALSRARAMSQAVACKSLLRQYALASMMYMNDNDGVMVDIHKYLDYSAGLARYMQKDAMDETVTRCPGDQERRLGTMGSFTSPHFPAAPDFDHKIYRKDGTPYTVRVSIGANISPFSSSLFVSTRTTPTKSPRWIKPAKLKLGGNWDPTKVMLWSDYQNNPHADAPEWPLVRPGTDDATDGTRQMGSIVFRHTGRANVAFLDGHVGTISPKIRVINDGYDLAEGADWQPADWSGTVNGVTMKPLRNHYQLYYPFGPGLEGKTPRMFGDYPTIQID